MIRRFRAWGRIVLARLDGWFNSLYTWRYNPLYHSGALVVGCFVILLFTGLYLLLFYRIGSPYESVGNITAQWWGGRWIRGLHRYISDMAIVATVVHAARMFVQGRTWGPRALAWMSGVVLLGVFFLCGWTGYVMVWDVHGQVLATEGARIMDALPIFAGPIRRTFVGEEALPQAFFFLNLFAHILIPVGIALVLWIHVSRLARTYLMPPKPLFWTMTGLFTLVAIVWPIGMAPKADLLRLPTEVPFDIAYGFWLPFTQQMGPGWVWLAVIAAVASALLVPALMKPKAEKAPAPSWVNPRFCTGCEQCYHDCPYEAIDMIRRDDGREGFVGFVNPDKCVSCGICSGSCAPMGVGPPERTGRDQMVEVKAFMEEASLGGDDIVIIGCFHGAAGEGIREVAGAKVYQISCVGSLHTSVIEYFIRAGVGGVMIASCPPRDCWNREGVTWLEERVYNQREAELKDRVDRRRLRIVYAAEAELSVLEREVASFRSQMSALDRALSEQNIEIDVACVVPEVSVGEEIGA
mgnify:CR=1 FL=1